MKLIGRYLSLVLWFGIRGGWIYYVVLGAYAALVATGIWLLSRPGWLPIMGGLVVLLDGLTLVLLGLHHWLNRTLRQEGR
ncbi:MAG: hypothetical protein JOZ46_08440 [Candidatus Dormibacteraeota bacterium]|nr:hypothetical protein [Candidatus Dormibacteraeota bacterium]MBV9525824.1 hypothetical protein [Candidatus Dormibacteraeota bacterium]